MKYIYYLLCAVIFISCSTKNIVSVNQKPSSQVMTCKLVQGIKSAEQTSGKIVYGKIISDNSQNLPGTAMERLRVTFDSTFVLILDQSPGNEGVYEVNERGQLVVNSPGKIQILPGTLGKIMNPGRSVSDCDGEFKIVFRDEFDTPEGSATLTVAYDKDGVLRVKENAITHIDGKKTYLIEYLGVNYILPDDFISRNLLVQVMYNGSIVTEKGVSLSE